MDQPKCECEGFSERNRIAAGSQWDEPHYRRDHSFTPRKITKRKRLQGPACDSFRWLGQSGSGGKFHRDFGPIAANSPSAYANRDTLRLASPSGQAWYEALDSPAPARAAIYSFRGLTSPQNSEVSPSPRPRGAGTRVSEGLQALPYKRTTKGKGWSLRLHLQAVYISVNDMCITTIFQPLSNF